MFRNRIFIRFIYYIIIIIIIIIIIVSNSLSLSVAIVSRLLPIKHESDSIFLMNYYSISVQRILQACVLI